MRKLSDFHDYQLRAVNHQIYNPFNFLWLFMGAGKTPITLTTIAHLKKHNAIRAALVLGPLRVVESVWEQEARKWEHLTGLRFSLIHGNVAQRCRAIVKPADVYLINYEGLAWLKGALEQYYISKGYPIPFDMLVVDESTKVKNVDTVRMEALLPLMRYFIYRTGLTGTPATKGLIDLFGQFLVIDGGHRLGYSLSAYQGNYFEQADGNGYRYTATEQGKFYIHRQVSDITLEMSQADYLKLPDFIEHDIYVDFSPKHRRQYDELEMTLFTELDDGAVLDLEHEVSKITKCLQMSNGAVYTDPETKEWSAIHDTKLDALEDIVEEAAGEPVLVAYGYNHDAIRIMKKFPYAKNITGMKREEFAQAMNEWQRGDLKMLLGHPASMGHGIDGLQMSGTIIAWYGVPWSLELYLQTNARLHRQGQTRPVHAYRIITGDTWDIVVKLNIEANTQTQEELRAAVKAYRESKLGIPMPPPTASSVVSTQYQSDSFM